MRDDVNVVCGSLAWSRSATMHEQNILMKYTIYELPIYNMSNLLLSSHTTCTYTHTININKDICMCALSINGIL